MNECCCRSLYPKLKMYDHLKKAEEIMQSLEYQIEHMKKSEAKWYDTIHFSNGHHDAQQILHHLKIVHDKYAKQLGMQDE